MCGLVPGVLPSSILCNKKDPGNMTMHAVVTIVII